MFKVDLVVHLAEECRVKQITLPFVPHKGLRVLDGDYFITLYDACWCVDSQSFVCGAEFDIEPENPESDGWFLPDRDE
jgi:hypothetical protein